MYTRETHKIVRSIISKYDGLRFISSKTRRTVTWRIPHEIKDRYSTDIRMVEFHLEYLDEQILSSAIDELNVFLILKNYPIKINPFIRKWRSEASFSIFAILK